jgi:hypothetical protein
MIPKTLADGMSLPDTMWLKSQIVILSKPLRDTRVNSVGAETSVRFKGPISWKISRIAGLFGHHAHMMFQRRPFISQRK